MTLPPERIAVKRRRDDEPVDALYIPYKKTKQTLVWNRVSQDDLRNDHHQSSSSAKKRHGETAHHPPQVPIVKSTLPEGDTVASQAHQVSPLQSTASEQPLENQTSQPREDCKLGSSLPDARHCSLPCLPKEPRRFHFTPATTSSKTTSTRASSVCHSGIQKNRKKQRKDFAIFVERTYELGKIGARVQSGAGISQRDIDSSTQIARSSVEPSTPRKRPLASPAERKWRAQTWKQPSGDAAIPASDTASFQVGAATANDDSDASPRLARELQRFALEESQRADEPRHLTKKMSPKIMPKPPKPRLSKEEADTPMNDVKPEGDEEDPDTFVIDVYVRQPDHLVAERPVALPGTSMKTADPDKVGLLVIEDEDQENWELYGEEEQSSDDGWTSDEEDENGLFTPPTIHYCFPWLINVAEDYYGNDYPEDELDSDDEYDRNTYTHWQSAFDEEELDGNIDWSDEETQVKNTWNPR
ncbi:MAG: hypothetical protein Q9226_000998 [Calogaya cf. arnoldii]